MEDGGTSTLGRRETIADLRTLYRSAEARSARLKLLIEAGRELFSAERDEVDAVLKVNARRAAHFAGCRDGEITADARVDGIPLIAPGPDQRRVGTLRLLGGEASSGEPDGEDREALTLLAQLLAAAVDRSARDEERDRLLSTLQEREQRLEHLVGRLFTAQEDERRYVSRELHDGVAQTATALFRLLDSRKANDDDAALATMAQGLVRELRVVISGLRPTVLDDLGLGPAIETLADALRADGYRVSFSIDVAGPWPPSLAAAYFRIAQEALSNIRKHAGGPCAVEIALSGNTDRAEWKLSIRDHGRGMAAAPDRPSLPGQHVGLEMMQERMQALGGTLEIVRCQPGVLIVAETRTTK